MSAAFVGCLARSDAIWLWRLAADHRHFHNLHLRVQEVGLVFVAVYQRALSLTYVDELLDSVVGKFLGEFDVQRQDYSTFNDTFRQLVLEAEKQSAERAKVASDRGRNAGWGGSAG